VPEAARDILTRLGGMPLTYPGRKKNPTERGWQQWRFTLDDIPDKFPLDKNLGMFDGYGDLHDIDLDAAECRRLASLFLPATSLVGGRASKPYSHCWYRVTPALRTCKFIDPCLPDHNMLVECRGLTKHGGIGLQTMVWPSIHPEGELVIWHDYGLPAPVAGDVLLQAVRRLAAASLLARYWAGHGNRENASLALAGGLLRLGMAVDAAQTFILAIAHATDDDEAPLRATTVPDTKAKLDRGEAATGWPTLVTLLRGDGRKIVHTVQRWLFDIVGAAEAAADEGADVFDAWLSDDRQYGVYHGQFFRLLPLNPLAQALGMLPQPQFISNFATSHWTCPGLGVPSQRGTKRKEVESEDTVTLRKLTLTSR
jgi:hypothetical protein